jgi:hypothetical protein
MVHFHEPLPFTTFFPNSPQASFASFCRESVITFSFVTVVLEPSALHSHSQFQSFLFKQDIENNAVRIRQLKIYLFIGLGFVGQIYLKPVKIQKKIKGKKNPAEAGS